jgi:ABC-type branched-subunit amino acid transport system substrate-binding protein
MIRCSSLKTSAVAGTALALLAVVAGCGSSGSSASSGATSTILIGSVFPMSGPDAEVGVQALDGIKVAVNQQNAAGGVQGHKLKVVSADDQATPSAGVAAMRSLSGNGVKFAIAGALSPVCAAEDQQAQRLGMLTVIGLCSGSTLTGAGVPSTVLRIVDNNVSLMGAASYVTCHQLAGVRRYDQVYQDYQTGSSQAVFIQHLLAQCGIKPGATVKVPLDATNMLSYVGNLETKIASGSAQNTVLFFNLFGGALGSFISAGNSSGVFSKYKYVLDWQGDEAGLVAEQASMGANMPKIYQLNSYDNNSTSALNTRFVAAYKAIAKSAPTSLSAIAYEDAGALIKLLKKSSSVDSAQDASQNIVGLTIQGFEGPITVDSGHQGHGNFVLHTWGGPTGPALIDIVPKTGINAILTPANVKFAASVGGL